MNITNLFSLLCGLSLFMFGMSLMGDALKKAAGNKLETLLAKLTNTPLKGILLGTGVTAIIQSSSATSVMTVGFVNSGMMKFRQSIGIILGSLLGTSITGWIIAMSSIQGGEAGWLALLSTDTIMGIIAVMGIIFRSSKKYRNAGEIMLGFAVLMIGIETMSASMAPLKDSPAFVKILTMFSNPFLGIVAGTLFTAVLQSASAAVGILQSMTATGAIDFQTSLPILLGISIGAAVPVLISAFAANTEGKR
ncbi:MAG: Na/Pi symporter, partial [Ruminococcus sp.]|nr:Na/Pi symporter [Ruminococcus sp.]